MLCLVAECCSDCSLSVERRLAVSLDSVFRERHLHCFGADPLHHVFVHVSGRCGRREVEVGRRGGLGWAGGWRARA